MTKDEALRMAIEAFEPEESTWWSHTKMAKAYQACKEALEQPAQEPIHNCPNCNSLFTKEIHSIPAPAWQSLSGEEFVDIAKSIWGDNLGMGDGYGSTVAWASSYSTIEPSSKMLLLYRKIDETLRDKNG